MKKITIAITAELCSVLGITDSATDMDVVTAIKKVTDQNTALKATETKLSSEKVALEDKIKELETSDVKKEVKTLLDEALKAKKLTVEVRNSLENDYAENPKSLKKLLDAMPAYASVVGQINEQNKTASDEFVKMSWDELAKADKLAKLKEVDPKMFAEKYEAKFGKKLPE